MIRRATTLLAAALLANAVHAAGVNDTGVQQCYGTAATAVTCSATVGGDSGENPRQDGRYGRDAAFAATQLAKTGAGAGGFDFSKISNAGAVLPAAAALGGAAGDWACTRDNVTGLMWEVKVTSGLRSNQHRYAWYSTAAQTNGGNAGAAGSNTCGGTLSAAPYNDQCNTSNFVAAVNAVALCGFSDWRLPTRQELTTLVHAGIAAPTIDAAYFPNTGNDYYWTSATSALDLASAWAVDFNDGAVHADKKSYEFFMIRLVRSLP